MTDRLPKILDATRAAVTPPPTLSDPAPPLNCYQNLYSEIFRRDFFKWPTFSLTGGRARIRFPNAVPPQPFVYVDSPLKPRVNEISYLFDAWMLYTGQPYLI